MQFFAFCLWCPPFVWSMAYKFVVLVAFLLFCWNFSSVVWGGLFGLLVVSLFYWLSFRRGCRAYAAWVEKHPDLFEFPEPFSPDAVTLPSVVPVLAPDDGDPLVTSFFLFVFLSRLVTPFINRRAAALHRWWGSEEHDRLVILLRVTGAFPRIPLYLSLCAMSALAIFAFVPSILDLDLPPLDE